MTYAQVQWAKSHDWFRGADTGDDDGDWSVNVLETGTQLQPDGTVVEYSEPHTFTGYQALRAWAGY